MLGLHDELVYRLEGIKCLVLTLSTDNPFISARDSKSLLH